MRKSIPAWSDRCTHACQEASLFFENKDTLNPSSRANLNTITGRLRDGSETSSG